MTSRCRIARVAAALALSIAAADAVASDYRPVACETAKAYEGAPVLARAVDLPAEDFAFGPAFDTATAKRLDDALDTALQRTKAAAMTAAVGTRGGWWQSSRTIDGKPAPRRFYWASVGKAPTAAVVMQLVQEGKVSLDAPISRWLPEFPNSGAITVDHLLQHTSGVFSANEDLVVRRERHYRSSAQNIAIAKKHGAMFCPGQRWRYSNTGFEMLGTIIEAIEQRPYREVIDTRIAARLGLATLHALAPDETPDDVAALAPTNADEPAMVPSWGNAAGSVVASAGDMLRFWHALLTSKLLARTTTQRMFERLYPMFDPGTYYGRGVMVYSFAGDDGGMTWLGHSGGAPGAKALVAYSPDDDAFVAVALAGDGSAEASANLLLRTLRTKGAP